MTRSPQRALFHVQSAGKSDVTGADLLVAMYAEPESYATYVLKQAGLMRRDVTLFLAGSASNDNTLRVWDCDTGECLGVADDVVPGFAGGAVPAFGFRVISGIQLRNESFHRGLCAMVRAGVIPQQFLTLNGLRDRFIRR